MHSLARLVIRSGYHSQRSLTISAPIRSFPGALWFEHPASKGPTSAWSIALYAVPFCGAATPLSVGGSGNAVSRIIFSFSSRVIAVEPPLMSGLALSSGRGFVYLTAVHTSSPLAFSRKLFQQAFLARLIALRRSRRAALVASVLFSLWARFALPNCFLSSEISSVYQRLEHRQTLIGLANSSSMLAAVSRTYLASSSTPSLVTAASPLRSAASSHVSSPLPAVHFLPLRLLLWSPVCTLELPEVPPGGDIAGWSPLIFLHNLPD